MNNEHPCSGNKNRGVCCDNNACNSQQKTLCHHAKRVVKFIFAGTVVTSLAIIAYSLVELNNGHKIDTALLNKRAKQIEKLAKKHGKTAKKLAHEKAKNVKRIIA